ncbi:GNAT family N-acetyltransferase [Haloarcula marina]|uniref:GNAT family N-acetyltransferase n=1 Tax=Haloarcula marina TaxID=2961574 RepID=UPI0020B74E92|nr:GNAT family N-acetyltransferase [Halomicroarcula marina]
MLGKLRATDQYAIDICTDRNEWNSFIERNDGPVYTHWGWYDAVASYGHDQQNLVARRQDTGAIAAALPICHINSHLFGSQLLSPAFAERGAVVFDRENHSTTARRLLLEQTKQLAERLDIDFVSLRGATGSSTDDFTSKKRYVTFQVPVEEGPDAIWSKIRDSRQRQIRQAADNDNLELTVGTSLEDVQRYYDLYLETMHRHGSPPHSFEFFRILWERLHKDGKFRLTTIDYDGTPINGIINLALGSTVYQWGVVNDYEYRDLNGGSLLLWKSLEQAAEEGYDTYEFGRTREGSGVYMFKKSFGGTKVWYDDIHYFPNGEVNLPNPEKNKYERAREVWKLLPLSVAGMVGPHVRKQIGI